MMEFNSENTSTPRIAIITGAAGFLGKYHAESLLELGFSIALTDLDQKKLAPIASELKTKYPFREIICLQLDVTDETSVVDVCEKLKQSYTIAILINNAAIDAKVSETGLESTNRLENFSIEVWTKELEVGLTGAFLCSKIFGSEMAKNRSGVIVNVASDLSVIAPKQSLYEIDGLNVDQQPVKPITYSVIKSGLIGLTKYLATYWATKGVRINAISPAGIINNQNQAFLGKLMAEIPLGRLAKPEEVGDAIKFLCSDSSSFITGHNLIIDGGRTIW